MDKVYRNEDIKFSYELVQKMKTVVIEGQVTKYREGNKSELTEAKIAEMIANCDNIMIMGKGKVSVYCQKEVKDILLENSFVKEAYEHYGLTIHTPEE